MKGEKEEGGEKRRGGGGGVKEGRSNQRGPPLVVEERMGKGGLRISLLCHRGNSLHSHQTNNNTKITLHYLKGQWQQGEISS